MERDWETSEISLELSMEPGARLTAVLLEAFRH